MRLQTGEGGAAAAASMTTITGSNPLSAYVPGTKAWFTDKDEGWVSATLVKPVSTSAKGEVTLSFTMDDSGAPRQVTTTLEKIEQQKSISSEDALPPLRNPPLLEATDDLTNLSYLNEPAGALQQSCHRRWKCLS